MYCRCCYNSFPDSLSSLVAEARIDLGKSAIDKEVVEKVSDIFGYDHISHPINLHLNFCMTISKARTGLMLLTLFFFLDMSNLSVKHLSMGTNTSMEG